MVVVGGGFAGATCARFIKRMDARIIVTVAEAVPTYFAWPMSNAAIAGLHEFSAQEFGYQKVTDDGVTLNAPALRIDAQARLVMLSNGARLSYDRLVLAPGIDLRWDALPGLYGKRRRAHATCLEDRQSGGSVARSARNPG